MSIMSRHSVASLIVSKSDVCTPKNSGCTAINSSQVAPTTGLYWNTLADSHAQPLHSNATLRHNAQTCYPCECVRTRNLVNYLWMCESLPSLVSKMYQCTIYFCKCEYPIHHIYLVYLSWDSFFDFHVSSRKACPDVPTRSVPTWYISNISFNLPVSHHLLQLGRSLGKTDRAHQTLHSRFCPEASS